MYKIIIAEKYDDNKFLVDKEKLEKMLEDAYMDGYREGRSSHIYYPYIYTTTSTNGNDMLNKKYTITSDSTSVPYTYTQMSDITTNGIR